MPWAMLTGAVGGAVADLLTAPIWALPTFLIKAVICLPFTRKKQPDYLLEKHCGCCYFRHFVACSVCMCERDTHTNLERISSTINWNTCTISRQWSCIYFVGVWL